MIGKSRFRKYLDWETEQYNRKRDGVKLIAILIFLIVLGLLTACKTLQKPTNSHERDDDSIRTEYRIDTLIVDRWHTIVKKGDTVYIHDSIDRWRIKHDSIYAYRYINTTDTITNTVTVVDKGSQFLRNSGIALWVLLAILLLAVIAGIVIKFAK